MRSLSIMSLLGAWMTFAVVLQLAGDGAAVAPDATKRALPPPIRVGLAQEQLADKPAAARAESVPATAKGAGRANDGVAIRIDATFDDPAGTVRWMLRDGGWMAVVVDRNHQPVGRVLQDGKVVPPGVVTSGIPRQATAEVVNIMPQGLPPGATAVWLVWPSRSWGVLERGLRAYGDVRSAKIRYTLTPQGLAVTVVEVQTAQGVIRPNAVFNIRS